jgi:riboflavin kinase/FMN adenylyltransferase
MKIYRNLEKLPTFKNAVLTIGSFDGVHIGHQQIIKKINNLATSIDGESVLITFHPHPRLVVSADSHNLRLINTLEEKAALLDQYKVDALIVAPFSKEFANQSPDDYIRGFLVEHFQPKIIVIGYDHKFGKNRAGNISYLRKFEEECQFKVIEISKQEVADIAVSSTKVRKALMSGEVHQAKNLLGHAFSLSGVVVKGLQLGSKIGFPTANVEVAEEHKLIPPDGIYAVYAYYDNVIYGGMLYIGNRPTIDNNLKQTIEVNIFEFDMDIYGKELKIDFIEYLRADQKFDTLEELKLQLKKDETAALNALK